MTISFNDIFTRCQNISSYEGTRLKDSEGDSLYEVVHIIDQDKTLVYEYALECAGLIAKALRFALDGVTYADQSDTTFTFISDTSLHGSEANMTKDIVGTIVAYVMANWMSNKDEQRANVWRSIHAEMFKSLPRGVYRKRPTRPVVTDDTNPPSTPPTS